MSDITSLSEEDFRPTGWRRWWIYQRERFPLLAHGIAILVFSFAAIEFGWLVSGKLGQPGAIELAVSFITSFVFFALLRIADEFKDFADDARYRPYRAVPRGLVRLPELGRLGVVLVMVQCAVALTWSIDMALPLIATWRYFLLMSREFFVARWLKAHPVIYLFSHMAIMPLIALCASAPGWIGNADSILELGPLLGLALTVGLGGEIGRKIRAPADEEAGVETYSSLWGTPVAVTVWLASVAATAYAAAIAADVFDAGLHYINMLACGWLLSLCLGVCFACRPHKFAARAIEAVSGLWALIGFGSLVLFARYPLSFWS